MKPSQVALAVLVFVFHAAACVDDENEGVLAPVGQAGSSGSSAAGGSCQSGTSASAGAGGNAGVAGSGAQAGSNAQSGDCDSSADCQFENNVCTEIVSGGFRVCASIEQQATYCATPALDECCSSEDCSPPMECMTGPYTPLCTGDDVQSFNMCVGEFCTDTGGCAVGEICVPRGVLGYKVRGCIQAHCMVDNDCAEYPNGICAPANDPCCNTPIGLFCVYHENKGCRITTDCSENEFCVPNPQSGRAECQTGSIECPP